MIMVVVGDLSNFDGSAYYSFPDVLQRNIDTEVGSRESQVKADDDLEAQRAAILHQFHYENIEILAIVEVRQSSCQSLFGYCLQGCFVVKGTV
eukprot:m.119677 g.119677  ORF g.119677 m.119677 type:complete len:93 (-) comp15598_c0_seq24:3450-3728(-)